MVKKPAEGHMSNRILIIGASGFIGQIFYKELLSYFDVYGTYTHQQENFERNQVFFEFDCENHSIETILRSVQPSFIISCFKGPIPAILKTHKILNEYCIATNSKILYVSSAKVFDAKGKFPSYEKDTPLSESEEGRKHIAVEKCIFDLPKTYYAILRLPMILGVNAPLILQLKQAIKHHASFEVFPNLIISATTTKKLAQQIHYIINKKLFGIFHLSSQDVTHHDDLFMEISSKLSNKTPIFKKVFSSNEDQFLAILPKENKLPKNYKISIEEVIAESTLMDEIMTLKKE